MVLVGFLRRLTMTYNQRECFADVRFFCNFITFKKYYTFLPRAYFAASTTKRQDPSHHHLCLPAKQIANTVSGCQPMLCYIDRITKIEVHFVNAMYLQQNVNMKKQSVQAISKYVMYQSKMVISNTSFYIKKKRKER
jgi:hypothetical protein